MYLVGAMPKGKISLIRLLLISLILPAVAIAASGERFTKDGYSFDISADQMGSDILVRVSISGGDSCKKLFATLCFQNEDSKNVSVKVIVNNYGGYERFSIRKRISTIRTSRWSVSKVYISSYK